MATVTIQADGTQIETLAELLRPGLRAVVVGLNPSPVSVAAGHYFQGALGRRLWQRLQRVGIVRDLPPGSEDDEAFLQGIGFADVVRVPSRSANELSPGLLRRAAPDLCQRLQAAGIRPPTKIVFVFSKGYRAAAPLLEQAGFEVLKMPGPYASTTRVESELLSLAAALSAMGGNGTSQDASAPAATREDVIARVSAAADGLEQRFGVTSLALFGSAGRDELSSGSDVDILVEFSGRVDFDRYFGVKFLLEDLLGRPVDLATDKMLKPRLRAGIAEDLVRVA